MSEIAVGVGILVGGCLYCSGVTNALGSLVHYLIGSEHKS